MLLIFRGVSACTAQKILLPFVSTERSELYFCLTTNYQCYLVTTLCVQDIILYIPILMSFFYIMPGNRNRICHLWIFLLPCTEKGKLSPKHRGKEDTTTVPHTTPQLFDLDWVESWQSASLKQLHFLQTSDDPWGSDVCSDNEVSNCTLVRKQVHTE